MKTTSALIVDDSLLFREKLQQELERDINIRVVAKAADAYEAGRKITELAPDVVIVDVVMDGMDGIAFVRQLLPQYDVPVILISAHESVAPRARSIPGVQFLPKPADGNASAAELFYDQLRMWVRAAANQEPYDAGRAARLSSRLIAIGASTGGAEALESLLTALPSSMPPIVIAQHMPAAFTRSFAQRLNGRCRLSVKEAEDGDVVVAGQVYVAPGGKHMTIWRRNTRFSVSCEDNVSGSPICPCIDLLFQSVASAVKSAAIGVLLTGMGRDGAEGLKQIRDAGGKTIGQDEASSVIYGMPKAAFDLGAVSMQLDLRGIPGKLVELSQARQ